MAVYVYACLPEDFDESTGTCAAAFFIEQPSALPTLTIEHAAEIGAACALLFAVAWVFRRIGKAINQIG